MQSVIRLIEEVWQPTGQVVICLQPSFKEVTKALLTLINNPICPKSLNLKVLRIGHLRLLRAVRIKCEPGALAHCLQVSQLILPKSKNQYSFPLPIWILQSLFTTNSFSLGQLFVCLPSLYQWERQTSFRKSKKL